MARVTASAVRPADHQSPQARPLLRGLGYPLAVWAGSRAMVYLILAIQGWTSRRRASGMATRRRSSRSTRCCGGR
jgi:hypothetical protein